MPAVYFPAKQTTRCKLKTIIEAILIAIVHDHDEHKRNNNVSFSSISGGSGRTSQWDGKLLMNSTPAAMTNVLNGTRKTKMPAECCQLMATTTAMGMETRQYRLQGKTIRAKMKKCTSLPAPTTIQMVVVKSTCYSGRGTKKNGTIK